MHTEANLTADAMRITAQDLDHAIEVIRTRIRRGQSVKGSTYLALVRHAHDLREKAQAAGATGPSFNIVEPRPFRTGFVGISAAEVKAREWIGAGDPWGGRTLVERRIAA